VALGDEVGAGLGARAVVVLVGERPGLSSADSLGLYLTWAPRPGRADSERNCISNVRPPHGLGYAQAADTLVGLLGAARELGASGVVLKDEGPALPPGAG
jgi:ethanolamine ammonia-lyase small subunit